MFLERILQTIQEANLTVNLKKCHFGTSRVKYLGHVVGSGSHEPDRGRIQVKSDLVPPQTKKVTKVLRYV